MEMTSSIVFVDRGRVMMQSPNRLDIRERVYEDFDLSVEGISIREIAILIACTEISFSSSRSIVGRIYSAKAVRFRNQ